jgi:hypothetical protein
MSEINTQTILWNLAIHLVVKKARKGIPNMYIMDGTCISVDHM